MEWITFFAARAIIDLLYWIIKQIRYKVWEHNEKKKVRMMLGGGKSMPYDIQIKIYRPQKLQKWKG